ncbi:hypothetical protein Sthe_1484 [Sphaerobacter thermophilus DSM 20745]|uniref:Uncharacterized protein n=1 Tax=Sphaerobacter thermophilus (strain ATCC 49802 / DSM 20745 / KCCM 41009 / NCIMB 13125 / S 6022) TaxID=479434 RepID=D1C3V2_SPHTD|nr:hypothetical protein Sthe_1484 [Sphaerobacter thermophilus DSM 20745]
MGWSTRRIAKAVGVHKDTVRNDLMSIGEISPPAATITGRDGKQYPARRPATTERAGARGPYNAPGGPIRRDLSAQGKQSRSPAIARPGAK